MKQRTVHPPETFGIFVDTSSFTAVGSSDISFWAHIDTSKYSIDSKDWYINAHSCENGNRVILYDGQITPGNTGGNVGNIGGEFPAIFSDYRLNFSGPVVTMVVRLQESGLSRDSFLIFAKVCKCPDCL